MSRTSDGFFPRASVLLAAPLRRPPLPGREASMHSAGRNCGAACRLFCAKPHHADRRPRAGGIGQSGWRAPRAADPATLLQPVDGADLQIIASMKGAGRR